MVFFIFTIKFQYLLWEKTVRVWLHNKIHIEQIQLTSKRQRYPRVGKPAFIRKLWERVTHILVPVQIPYYAGSIFTDTYHYTVWFAHKQACYFCSVSIQMDLWLHFYLWRLKNSKIKQNLMKKKINVSFFKKDKPSLMLRFQRMFMLYYV